MKIIGLVLLLGTSICSLSDAQILDQDSIVNHQDSIFNKQYRIKSVAYGVLPAWKVTAAITTIEGSELQRSFTSNLATTLFGRLAGLTVTQEGNEPGLESPGLFIRGIGTYGSGREPLILVDGFESNFEALTPYEIASISVLKDAAATALYGSRGANGVILVTTKRGKKGPLVINFTVQTGFHQAMRFPDFLGSFDYARLYNEALLNDGKQPYYTDADLKTYRAGSDPYFHPDINWYDKVLRRTSPISNYNLNFSGGNDQVRYFGLLNVLSDHNLLIKGENLSANSENGSYRRYNFRANIDVDLTKTISAHLTLSGSVEDKTNPVSNNTESLFNKIASIPPNAFPVYNPNGSYGGSALLTNPLADLLETGSYTSNGRTLQSTLKLTDKLDNVIPGLSASAALSFNNFFRNYSNKTREYARFAISQNDQGDTIYNQFGKITSLEGHEGKTDQWRSYSFAAFLNYSRIFGHHSVEGMVMYKMDNYSTYGQRFPFKHVGLGGRLTYANQDKYIAQFSFSYMGSGNFPKGKKFGFFPAVSVGWIASKEAFLKESKIINYLKINGSYGLIGNDDIGGGRFLFETTYDYSAGYHFGESNSSSGGLEEGRVANPNITWEKDQKVNIGIDAILLRRMSFSLDLFKNHRYDILATPDANLPDIFGMDPSPLLNEGIVDNKGFEASLGYKSKRSDKWQYQIGVNVWYAENKIVYMSEGPKEYMYQRHTGLSIDQPFALEATGFFKNNEDIASSPKQVFNDVRPGDIKYKDQNGDGVINASDYAPEGNTTLPRLTLGFKARVDYKYFDLELLFQAVTDRTVYLGGLYYEAFQNNGKISSAALGRWTPETAETATYPRLSAENNLNNYKHSTFWMIDGSFVKLRSIELGYTFREDIIKKVGIDKLRLFINGTNLFSIDHLDYSDPETLTGYPAVRTVSMGVRIQF